MRKSMISLILAAALLVSLAGCAENKPQIPEKPAAAEKEVVPSTAPVPEKGDQPSPEKPEARETVPLKEPAQEEPVDGFVFTRENMPRLDGSTSTAPLAVAVCSALLGESREEVEDLVDFHKTTTSYYNLIWGNADLLIVGEANDDVLAQKEQNHFEWLKEPFATDAFVFVVNENNPVDSITVDEARKIYTGEITNWSQLGGDDLPITAFQRNQGAGSQTLMEKLVMQGQPMMDAPEDYVVGTMDGLIRAVKGYDNSAGAIGYTVYYYAEEMRMAKGLKLLHIDGVEPNPATIRSEEYPLLNPKYVVIDAKSAEDSPARILYNWLLSEEGQKVVAEEGYVSVVDFPITEREPLVTPDILIGSRWYEDYTDELIPRDDYGTLIPYAGQRLMNDWPSTTGCLFGLMTTDGVAVTDPVFQSIDYPVYYPSEINRYLPLLILRKADTSGEYPASRYAVAAADGSWVTDYDYWGYNVSSKGLVLFSDTEMIITDREGTAESTWELSELWTTDSELNELHDGVEYFEGVSGQRYGDYVIIGWVPDGNYNRVRCLNLKTGEIEEMKLEYIPDDEVAERPDIPIKEAAIVFDCVYNDSAPYLLMKASRNWIMPYYYYLADGTPLPQFTCTKWYQSVTLAGGIIGFIDLNTASYYRLDTMECVFRTYLGYDAD